MLRSRIRLAELVDFAERNNPETRVTWEGAKARGAGVAHRAERIVSGPSRALHLSQVYRQDVCSAAVLCVRTVAAFGPALQLDYTMFDFWGARGPHRDVPERSSLPPIFVFNDTHRKDYLPGRGHLLPLAERRRPSRGGLKPALLNAKTVQKQRKTG